MSKKNEIPWGKLNPTLAWNTFKDLREKGELSLEDCRGCKLTLENTRLNILDGLVNQFDYDILWIEDRMSEVEVSVIEIENNIDSVHQNLDYNVDKLYTKAPCNRCTMESRLCQFKLCYECCRESDCQIHGVIQQKTVAPKVTTKTSIPTTLADVTNPDFWKDHLSDDDDWADEPICQKCRRESARQACQRCFCRDCCNGTCVGCFSANQLEERERAERAELLSHPKKKEKNSKEIWADALFGRKEQVLECKECGNGDLFNGGQFKNFCYVCKKNIK